MVCGILADTLGRLVDICSQWGRREKFQIVITPEQGQDTNQFSKALFLQVETQVGTDSTISFRSGPSIRCGVRTELWDRRTGISFTQLCVGRVSDSTVPCPWPRAAGSIGDRIVFTHSPIQHVSPQEGASWETDSSRATSRNSGDNSGGGIDGGRSKSSFALVTVLSEPLEASITATLVQPPGGGHAKAPPLLSADMETELSRQGQPDEEDQGDGDSDDVAVILGPVVGRVEVVKQSGTVRESCRVPVVLEVDQEGEVTCTVRSTSGLLIARVSLRGTGGDRSEREAITYGPTFFASSHQIRDTRSRKQYDFARWWHVQHSSRSTIR